VEKGHAGLPLFAPLADWLGEALLPPLLLPPAVDASCMEELENFLAGALFT